MSIWIDNKNRRNVQVQVDGRRLHRILPAGTTAREAKQLESRLRDELTAAALPPKHAGDPPLAAVMALYIKHLEHLRSPETARFHAARITPWIDKYTASGASKCAAMIIRDMTGSYAPATINRSLGTLKKALTLAWEQEMIPENYGARIKRLPEHNERHTYLTLDQVNDLTSHASDAVAAAIWVALFTGCRRGEITKLKAEDVGDTTITIRAGNTKTLKTRTVPIIGPMRRWLPFIPLPINSEGLKSGFSRARVKAGMPDLHFHDLRHSCASILLASGADLYTISRILGHSSTKMTERYAHLQTDAQSVALERAFSETALKKTGLASVS